MGAGMAIKRAQATTQPASAVQPTTPATKTTKGTSVAIVYYSTYGHVLRMAEEVKKGLEAGGVEVDIFQVPETLPAGVLEKMHAPAKPAHIMTIDHAMVARLPEYDGFMFGVPTRFGMMATQMKAFFDSTGQLWQSGALAGKPAGFFVSTGTQNGGQETTAYTAVTQLVHHGMLYVPLGYGAGDVGQFDMTELHGGSPYGAGTLAGADGSRQPSAKELAVALRQGELFAAAVKRSVAPPPPAPRSCKVCIVYYSMYGHVKTMADEVAAAVRAAGVTVDLYQAPELLSEEVLQKMHAPPKSSDPVMEHSMIAKLTEYDGIVLGIPTRFGSMAAQLKAFLDSTGQLWQSGALAGKLVASFVSTGTQNGGQETTHMTALTFGAHHGMVFVPLGYQAGADGQFDMSELHGGSPWGSSCLAGADGSRQPSKLERAIAAKQGALFAAKVKQMAVRA